MARARPAAAGWPLAAVLLQLLVRMEAPPSPPANPRCAPKLGVLVARARGSGTRDPGAVRNAGITCARPWVGAATAGDTAARHSSAAPTLARRRPLAGLQSLHLLPP